MHIKIHSHSGTLYSTILLSFNDVNFIPEFLYSFRNFCAATFAHYVTRLAWLPEPTIFRLMKMADERAESVSTSLFNWEQLFSAAWDLLDECERLWGTSNIDLRETIQIRLEALILSLQQILPFLTRNSSCCK